MPYYCVTFHCCGWSRTRTLKRIANNTIERCCHDWKLEHRGNNESIREIGLSLLLLPENNTHFVQRSNTDKKQKKKKRKTLEERKRERKKWTRKTIRPRVFCKLLFEEKTKKEEKERKKKRKRRNGANSKRFVNYFSTGFWGTRSVPYTRKQKWSQLVSIARVSRRVRISTISDASTII